MVTNKCNDFSYWHIQRQHRNIWINGVCLGAMLGIVIGIIIGALL